MNHLRAIWLFLRIFWRVDDGPTGHRMSIATAWKVSKIIHHD
jgi:hypothetical protein